MDYREEEMTVTRVLRGPGWTASLNQHYLPQPPRSEPDPDWSFTDKHGHVHRYERAGDGTLTTPTLILKTWTEYDEEGDELKFSETVCLECFETISPGMRQVPMPPVKSRFSGSYVGPVRPGFGIELRDFEVGDLIPGCAGTASMVRSETRDSRHRFATASIEFVGQGELKMPA